MSETAFTGGPRASQAYHWSGGAQMTAAEFAKLDVIQKASYLAVNPMPEHESYDRLRREDEGFDPDAIVPGTQTYDDGPTDANGDWK